MFKPVVFSRTKKDRLYVRCSYKDEATKSLIINDLRGSWNTTNKAWELFNTNSVLNTLLQNNIDLPAELIPEEPDFTPIKKTKNLTEVEDKIRRNSKTTPYDHQTALVDLTLQKKKVFFLCSVGTGKSKPAIDSLSILFSENKIDKALIVTPASVMENFQKEINVHSNLESILIQGSLIKRKDLIKNNPIKTHIINYDVLSKLRKDLKKEDYDAIIFDEIHFLKNHKSQRSKAAYDISKKAQYKIGLTGTLIANNFVDAFGPYLVIDDEIFGTNFNQFKNRYCVMGGYHATVKIMGRERKVATEIIGYKNKSGFKTKLAQNSLKFELKDVSDLPDAIEIKKTFTLTPKTKKLYNEMKNMMVVQKPDGGECSIVFAENHLDQVLKMQKIASGFLDDEIDLSNEKLLSVLEVLEETSKTDKIVVWCRFTKSIDRVVQFLEKHNISCCVFDGRSKDKTIYKTFNDDDTKVMVSQISKGIGWDIPNVRYSIFYELTYSRTDLVQSKGRTQRPASKHSQGVTYFYIYLLGKDTIDEKLHDVLKHKDFTSKEALEYVEGGKKG
jgi:SNF2 family DNA or RNA helicase|tara:strand:- start:323 stop:1993 length:1671 start_codon:yes stop_codon:yes gene_type:complete